MKLAYTIGTPEVERFPFGWIGDHERILSTLRAIGYTGVELQVLDPGAFDPFTFRQRVADHGLTICAVSTGTIGETEGFFLTSPDPHKRGSAIARYHDVIDFAGDIGVDCSIGRFRGMMQWAPTREEGIGWFRSALESFVEHAERRGIRIVLEPQHRMNLDFLNTIDETVAFIGSFGTHSLTFEADVFHAGLTEKSIPAALVRGMRSGTMSFVQVSDSNRLPPGMGIFNWVDVIETLRSLGYDGWISVECKQFPNGEAAARHSFNFLNAIISAPTELTQ